MKSEIIVYTYANCDTCRRAVKWLRASGVEFIEKAIRETPPPLLELGMMLKSQRGEMRRLFNTSGRDYRAQKLGERLPTMSEGESLALLASNGNLVKRPFLLGPKIRLVGFDEDGWAAAFAEQ